MGVETKSKFMQAKNDRKKNSCILSSVQKLLIFSSKKHYLINQTNENNRIWMIKYIIVQIEFQGLHIGYFKAFWRQHL